MTVTVKGSIEGVGDFTTDISLQALETRNVVFSNSSYPILNVQNPTLWWPWQMGEQHMHNLSLSASVNDVVSSKYSGTFGMRQVTDEFVPG